MKVVPGVSQSVAQTLIFFYSRPKPTSGRETLERPDMIKCVLTSRRLSTFKKVKDLMPRPRRQLDLIVFKTLMGRVLWYVSLLLLVWH